MKKKLSIVSVLLLLLMGLLLLAVMQGNKRLRMKDKFRNTFRIINYVESDYLLAVEKTNFLKCREDVIAVLRDITDRDLSFDDPYSPAGKDLSFTFDPLRIWSVGPDRLNNSSLIVYDPTNGLTSVGDIIIHPKPGREE